MRKIGLRVAIGLIVCAGISARVEAQPAAAAFAAPPVGAMLRYGEWSCRVRSVGDFRYVCAEGDKEATIFAGFLQLGDRQAAGFPGSVAVIGCGGQGISGAAARSGLDRTVGPTAIETGEAALRSLWPLAAGKSASVTLRVGAIAQARIEMRVRVERVERLQAAGHERSVHVVTATSDYHVCPYGAAQSFQTWWIDAAEGLMVRTRIEWRVGDWAGTREQHELTAVAYPSPATPTASRATGGGAAGTPAASTTPSIAAIPRPAALGGAVLSAAGVNRALVIGNGNYRFLPKLATPVQDARLVADKLTRDQSYIVDLVIDATRADMIRALHKQRTIIGADDRLIIFYSGHSILDAPAEASYWLPVDAADGDPANWFATGEITALMRASQARQILVVADAPYAGTLQRPPMRHETIASQRARTALVSGAHRPALPPSGGSVSAFAQAFIAALSGVSGAVAGQALFDAMRPGLGPQARYVDVRFSGHEGGDYIFVRP